jgi:hypothetical protein
MLRRLHPPLLAYSCALTRSRLDRIDPDIRFFLPYQPAASPANIQSCRAGALANEYETGLESTALKRRCTLNDHSLLCMNRWFNTS